MVEDINVGFDKIIVPYLKLEINKESGKRLHINYVMNFEKISDIGALIKLPLETSVRIETKVSFNGIEIDIVVISSVLLTHDDENIKEISFSKDIQDIITEPLLAKTSQVIANLTSDIALYPLIVDLHEKIEEKDQSTDKNN